MKENAFMDMVTDARINMRLLRERHKEEMEEAERVEWKLERSSFHTEDRAKAKAEGWDI